MINKKYVIPLIYIGMMFFTIGFTLGINSYLLPVLQSALEVSAGESYLILAANFGAYLLFGYPSSLLIKKVGYRRTMSIAFIFYTIGFLMYIPSAQMESLYLFLLSSFIVGTGSAILQAAINPYVTILGPIESGARRICIMGICNTLALSLAPILLSLIVGKTLSDVGMADIYKPFIIISIISFILCIIVRFSPLKEIKAVGEEEEKAEECKYASGKKSIFQFPHLLLGCFTLFLYVGAETIALAATVDFAVSMNLPNPDIYAIFPSIGMASGYILGIILIPKYISQNTALKICSFIAATGILLISLLPAAIAIKCVIIVTLGCSLMYPAIWPLAIVDLGKFTKTGSSLLVTSIVGGAIIPTCFGFLKDSIGMQHAYFLCLPCFLFIMYYAFRGCKIRTK